MGILRWVLLAALVVVAACATQGSDGRIPPGSPRVPAGRWYDYNTLRVSDQADIFQEGYGSYLLKCDGTFQDESGETTRFQLKGLASPIDVDGKIYFLGAGHVFDLEKAISDRGGSAEHSTVRPPAYYIDLGGTRFALRRVDHGTKDLALFVQDGGADFPRSRYKVGNSDDVRLGNPELCWGMPLLEGFELSIGIVSGLAAPRSLLAAAYPEASADDFFVTSMPTIFGYSGALVYAFRGGEPEVVGMLVAGYINVNRSIVYKINSVLRDAGLRRAR